MRTTINTTNNTTSTILRSRCIGNVINGTRMAGRRWLLSARFFFGWLAGQATGLAWARVYQVKPVAVTGAYPAQAWMGRDHLCPMSRSGGPRSEFPVTPF